MNNLSITGKDFRESNNGSLWHGLRIENFERILESNKLKPYTFHRYWLDGKLRKDKDKDYETSCWMKGWSTSRDRNYAMKFGAGILLELDQDYIKNNFKIIPISWNATMAGDSLRDHKREREEFILAFKTGKTSQDFLKEYQSVMVRADEACDLYGHNSKEYKLLLKEETLFREKYGNHINYMKEYKTDSKNIDFEKAVKNIYAEQFVLDIYKESKSNLIEKIVNHEKFGGLYCSELANKNYENSNPKNIIQKINIKRRLKN